VAAFSGPPQEFKMTAVSSPEVPLGTDELLAALNELLQAERAGARVARETAAQIGAANPMHGLVVDVQHDEVRWCGMLMRVIKALSATPTDQTGAFHGKAMAIDDLDERLVFLNRGQAWVVRRLQALIPRVADAGIKADLQAMLDAHVSNISRVEQKLAR
jgi:nitronate monooxygenase